MLHVAIEKRLTIPFRATAIAVLDLSRRLESQCDHEAIRQSANETVIRISSFPGEK